ncbi:MAG: hypothetical protein LUC34_06780, partial [Campylobacter sp.]|nr:hypothetical protein [Campylobacter sp.]
IMFYTVVILIIMVQIFQILGNFFYIITKKLHFIYDFNHFLSTIAELFNCERIENEIRYVRNASLDRI